MPIGGFIKASWRLPLLICTRTDSVASHNAYAVLDMDTDDDDPDGSPVDPAVLMIPPTLDGTATLAMDTLNTDGCTTLALTNTDMFDGSPHMAYLESGYQLPAVLQSPASLDELEITTGHLNGAVAGSQMTITHTGILSPAPGIALPAVVCPEKVAANLIGMLCCPCSARVQV